MTSWLALPILALLLVLPACASTERGAAGPYARLVIENDATLNVNVYALHHGNRMRIGSVTALSRGEFEIRSSMLDGGSELRLLIDPIGSNREYSAQSIYVEEGAVIELRVSSFVR